MNELINAAAVDLLQALDFTPAGTLVATANLALKRLVKKRGERARKIVLEEMRRGARDPIEVANADEFVAMAFRYSRAASEGAARINLRLMAKVMRSQVVDPACFASDFLAYADLISSLRRDEIIYLGTMLKWTRAGLKLPKENQFVAGGKQLFYDVAQSVEIRLKKDLPRTPHFPDRASLDACALAVQRTGLLRQTDATADGFGIFEPSPLLLRLAELADFEAALASEGIEIP